VNDQMKLVIALEELGILPTLDTLGAMYALEGVQKLEEEGWKFIPPEKEPE
jgi:hypothetical protein